MSANISPLAVVDAGATVAEDVQVGPFCLIEANVTIGPGTRLDNNVTIKQGVRIGAHNHFHAGSAIGGDPQDLSYSGQPTEVHIGDHNVFREGVTVNRGTAKDRALTTIGNQCYFMACSHVAHDCLLGDHIVMANGSMLGGHVHIDDRATISGGVAVHHFVSVGKYSFVSGVSRVLHDVPPFMLVEGVPTRPRCINIVALKRNDFSAAEIKAISDSHRLLYRAKVGLDQAREILTNNNQLLPPVAELLDFVARSGDGRHGRARDLRRAA